MCTFFPCKYCVKCWVVNSITPVDFQMRSSDCTKSVSIMQLWWQTHWRNPLGCASALGVFAGVAGADIKAGWSSSRPLPSGCSANLWMTSNSDIWHLTLPCWACPGYARIACSRTDSQLDLGNKLTCDRAWLSLSWNWKQNCQWRAGLCDKEGGHYWLNVTMK